MAKLDDPGLVIQEIAQGKQLSEVIGEVKKHTKKKLFGGGRKFRKNSPLRIFTDARAIRAMGAVTAVDLFIGNKTGSTSSIQRTSSCRRTASR